MWKTLVYSLKPIPVRATAAKWNAKQCNISPVYSLAANSHQTVLASLVLTLSYWGSILKLKMTQKSTGTKDCPQLTLPSCKRKWSHSALCRSCSMIHLGWAYGSNLARLCICCKLRMYFTLSLYLVEAVTVFSTKPMCMDTFYRCYVYTPSFY